MFGRAAITLGIGPHSSCFSVNLNRPAGGCSAGNPAERQSISPSDSANASVAQENTKPTQAPASYRPLGTPGSRQVPTVPVGYIRYW